MFSESYDVASYNCTARSRWPDSADFRADARAVVIDNFCFAIEAINV